VSRRDPASFLGAGFFFSGRRNEFAAIRIALARKVLLWPQVPFRKPRPPAGKRGFFLLRIRRIVKGCAAYRCAVITARFRAATINNLARASLALVLRALFGAPKSWALVKLCMVCPHGRLVASRARPNSVLDHGYLKARLTAPFAFGGGLLLLKGQRPGCPSLCAS
jgi:hypothetical protein